MRKPVEEMLAAEEGNQFLFERKIEDTDQEQEEYFEPEEDKYRMNKQEDSISNLAKKISETKLSQSPPKLVQSEEEIDAKDDDDLDIDLELENVDTTDVNLDDELSDD